MSRVQTLRVYDEVLTPKGEGVVWEAMYFGEELRIVVRVAVDGEEEPYCVTPRAKKSSLWAFLPEELEVKR